MRLKLSNRILFIGSVDLALCHPNHQECGLALNGNVEYHWRQVISCYFIHNLWSLYQHLSDIDLICNSRRVCGTPATSAGVPSAAIWTTSSCEADVQGWRCGHHWTDHLLSCKVPYVLYHRL